MAKLTTPNLDRYANVYQGDYGYQFLSTWHDSRRTADIMANYRPRWKRVAVIRCRRKHELVVDRSPEFSQLNSKDD